ncbi:hypothetical protein [Sandaracinus amylolyticus]|uniref:hypothetical protein n=2 Tax=Sandaracinus TaxID=1055688 RepID=UPI001F20A02A|nr:hypothetical protein [Sandaracinus amylolyticus]
MHLHSSVPHLIAVWLVLLVGCGPSGRSATADGGEGCARNSDCGDDNPCTDDLCVEGSCTFEPNTASCDDGLTCNGTDVCESGECAHSGDPCSAPTHCDEQRDACIGCDADSDCPAPTHGEWSECTSDVICGETGTRSRAISRSACESGVCVEHAETETFPCARDTEGAACGAATACTEWSACEGFESACDETGVSTRTCTMNACAEGACVESTATETMDCMRETDAAPCGDPSCEAVGTCTFESTCDETGVQHMNCRPAPTCAEGVCTPGAVETRSEACSRDTDGVACAAETCGSYGACTYSSTCVTSGSRIRTCTWSTCAAGACGGTGSRVETDTTGCGRDTNGTRCNDGDPCTSLDRCSGGGCSGAYCTSCCG